MNRLLAAAGALSLLAAAGPALASDGDTPVFAACTAPAGAIVVTPDTAGVTRDVETPVGALNAVGGVEVGDVYVDLAGRAVTSDAGLQLVLAWDNPVSDYDMVVDGTNDLATDNPEAKSVAVEHCTPVDVGVEVFYGVPVDALTLTASAVEVPVEEQ